MKHSAEDLQNMKIAELKEGHIRMQTALGYTPDGLKTGNGIVGSLESVKKDIEQIQLQMKTDQQENRAKLKSIEKIVWITTGIITTLITVLQIFPPLKVLLAI